MQRQVAILCNPNPSGRKAISIRNQVIRKLSELRIPFTLFDKNWPDSLGSFTQAWIIGGDGTLNYFINQYPGFDKPVTIFGGGTGNDFHWMLYGNKTVKEQLDIVLKGNIIAVDAGLCNGRLFLNGLGIGFDGYILRGMQGRKKLLGSFSYFFSILGKIARYRETVCTISADGKKTKKMSFMVSIANGKRAGGMFRIAPLAEISDSRLELLVIGELSFLSRLRYLPVLKKGKHLDLDFIHYNQGSSIQVECEQVLDAQLDGEYFTASVFDVHCLPGKFFFLV
jgi:diacylglycerol kinase (ATP)